MPARIAASRPVVNTQKVRPEIQALRALAVSLVLLYHLFPGAAAGGYVGVDVFFVISGYLITAHLLRELDSTGGIRLGRFYLRRARRLLPVSLVVLLATAIATALFVPQVHWIAFAQQFVSSALYFQNWQLAANAVSYSAISSDASPVQHFWSLSTEEQFYLVWPAILLIAWATAVRGGKSGLVSARAILLVVTLASFAYSLYLTSTNPDVAYFSTFTRAWEFGCGALLAAFALALKPTRSSTSALSWAGIIAIAVSALLYDDQTPFPGFAAALPVLGTAAIIIAGSPSTRFAPTALFRLRPVQYLGDISYSVYLWHWPVIVIVPLAVYGISKIALVAIVLAATFTLAPLSKKFIEDRFRTARPASSSTTSSARRGDLSTVLRLVGGMAVVCVAAGGLWYATTERAASAERTLAEVRSTVGVTCFGAASLTSQGACAPTGSPVVPDPVFATDNNPNEACKQALSSAEVITCGFGSERSDAESVLLVGDSHAQRWLPALLPIAEEENWHITTMWKSSCALSTVALEADRANGTCSTWSRDALAQIEKGGFDVVIATSVNGVEFVHDEGESSIEAGARGMADAWEQIEAAGIPVIAILDNPRPGLAGLMDPPSCVLSQDDPSRCDFSREEALPEDPIRLAAKAADVPLVDMTEYFCSGETCQSVIGDVLVYRDDSHVIDVYAETLSPFLEEKLLLADPALS
ncbi:acyltransferase family protein [Rathayibacter sp. VKM Ac-2803]|uniref:acyltransferase family protein n=1 Tax=Rathayibacter sp. VKM Ac-2803 TaxID=2609256 RepID=UPI00135CE6BD|nr:acyltransferase family protein [Rathayibacter sp. VKM Ac-2803]MWV50428.1 acyltransferase family protein [Rathayibacter sp. VKM Ac-2803]